MKSEKLYFNLRYKQFSCILNEYLGTCGQRDFGGENQKCDFCDSDMRHWGGGGYKVQAKKDKKCGPVWQGVDVTQDRAGTENILGTL